MVSVAPLKGDFNIKSHINMLKNSSWKREGKITKKPQTSSSPEGERNPEIHFKKIKSKFQTTEMLNSTFYARAVCSVFVLIDDVILLKLMAECSHYLAINTRGFSLFISLQMNPVPNPPLRCLTSPIDWCLLLLLKILCFFMTLSSPSPLVMSPTSITTP